MAIYAVGDVQGCYDELCRLIDRIDFQPEHDTLWLCGDLVNRGPASLEVLRLVRDLGTAAVAVLGNHDLHLLAVSQGIRPLKRRSDTFDDVLAAADAAELIDWLRHRPLIHYDAAIATTLVHAGLPPQWSIDDALSHAAVVHSGLRGEGWVELLRVMYGNEPVRWEAQMSQEALIRFTINALTRMRYCHSDGSLALKFKGQPGSQPSGLLPWFDLTTRANRHQRIVFGHWSTLGLLHRADLIALDTGCLWGGSLTAARLDSCEPTFIRLPCRGYRSPR